MQKKTPLRLALAATALAGTGLLGAGIAVAAEPDEDSGDPGTQQQSPMGGGMQEMMQNMPPEMRESARRMHEQCQSGMQQMMSGQGGVGGMMAG